jgi:hypothetical protein
LEPFVKGTFFLKKNLRVQSLRVKVCVTFTFMLAVCPYGAVSGYRQLRVFTFFLWFGTPNCIETHNHKPLCPVMNRSISTSVASSQVYNITLQWPCTLALYVNRTATVP